MERALVRRRGLALVALAVLAAGAFALGAGLGGGEPGRHRDPIASLSPGKLAGERIVVGLPGTAVPSRLRGDIRAGRVAGVVLFAANFPTGDAGARLIARLQAIPRPPHLRQPLLVMVDQEGGEVERVSGAPVASAAGMGARGAGFSRRQGKATAATLRRLGVNVDLAPVLDLALPGGVIAATERSFGQAPAGVISTAVPFAEGLQSGGVAATGKHFPGFGSATENTDFAGQRLTLSAAALRRSEAPFAAFVRAGGRLVMLSTAVYPSLSPLPAALSRAVATAQLRRRLGFGGVSITDSLDSAAVSEFGGPAKVGAAAARAGTDLLLFTALGPAEAAWRAMVAGLRSGRLGRPGFVVSARRVLSLRGEAAPPAG
jgi:beta-N-acetylhexosaminidase